ncbi:MAG TPA: sigma-70 family RNA polymerase sigma factor [Planctomycetota bacterium]|nr:sigma-70 family RNA polymerase sigma factor [Planctomycetota bacterium]
MGADDDSLDLVRRCLDGQEEAQRELVRRYTGLCLTIASRILGGKDRSHFEDAVQEAFYAIFARLGQWQGQNLPAWIGTITARQAIDLRRRLRRTRAERTGLDAADAAAPHSDGQADLAELRDAVEKARARMTLRQQRILDALLEGKPKGQIAREVALSPRMVYYELDAIRRLVRNSLGSIAEEDESGRL